MTDTLAHADTPSLNPSRSVGGERLRRRMARGAAFLGSETAILCGAMSWVSERHLVSAISNAGGFGLIACGAMTPELLDAEIAGTKALTDKPFGVNLITMHPMLFDLIEVCNKHGVSHVVLAGGLPPTGSIDAIKANGAKLICFAPALSLAKKLIRSGVDALVVEGMEAGGHIGPVSTSVLAQEILPEVADAVTHERPVGVPVDVVAVGAAEGCVQGIADAPQRAARPGPRLTGGRHCRPFQQGPTAAAFARPGSMA